MTKTSRKKRTSHHANQEGNSTTRSGKTEQPWSNRLKRASKKLLHDYAIPMTRVLERRLQSLENAL